MEQEIVGNIQNFLDLSSLKFLKTVVSHRIFVAFTGSPNWNRHWESQEMERKQGFKVSPDLFDCCPCKVFCRDCLPMFQVAAAGSANSSLSRLGQGQPLLERCALFPLVPRARMGC